MVHIEASGTFDDTIKYLEFLRSGKIFEGLDHYGQIGADLLASATPVNTGLAAGSWGYQIAHEPGKYSISWFNTDVEGGLNVAILIQYGHGTGTGGWVEGRDYINPAIQPLFDLMVDKIWMEVSRG